MRTHVLHNSSNISSVTAVGGLALFHALNVQTCRSLCVLNLSKNELGIGRRHIVSRLLEELKKFATSTGSTLTELDLGSNRFDCEAAETFKDMLLHKDCVLSTLALQGNHFTAQGTLSIASSISSSRLKHLDLSVTGCNDNAITLLCSGLIEDGCSLTELNLSHNQITNRGAKTLAAALANNNSLKTLSLYGNGIYGDGTLELVLSLVSNETLQKLSLMDLDKVRQCLEVQSMIAPSHELGGFENTCLNALYVTSYLRTLVRRFPVKAVLKQHIDRILGVDEESLGGNTDPSSHNFFQDYDYEGISMRGPMSNRK